MVYRSIKPPSSAPEGQQVASVAGICAALGLPKSYVSLEFLNRYIAPCVSVAFSDPELTRQHTAETDPVLREYFGVTDFTEGTFGDRLLGLADGGEPKLRYAVDELARLCGRWLARVAVQNPSALTLAQNVILDSSSGTVEFDDQVVNIGRPIRAVIDYGPGVQGRFHIDTQWKDLQADRGTFTYFALCRGPFVNEFLMSYWAESTNDPEIASEVIGRVYIGREDGMGTARAYLVEAQTVHTGNSEMADLVIASGVYAAGRSERHSAITNAHRLLRTGGGLLIRAPEAAERPADVTATEMTDIAMAAGFDPKGSEFFPTSTAIPGVPGLSAFLRK